MNDQKRKRNFLYNADNIAVLEGSIARLGLIALNVCYLIQFNLGSLLGLICLFDDFVSFNKIMLKRSIWSPNGASRSKKGENDDSTYGT